MKKKIVLALVLLMLAAMAWGQTNEELIQQATALSQTNWEKALEAVNLVIQAGPDNNRLAPTYRLRGDIYYQLDNLESAFADYEEALKRDPRLDRDAAFKRRYDRLRIIVGALRVFR